MKHFFLLFLALCTFVGFSQKHGPVNRYYDNGQLKIAGFYRNNIKIGAWKKYYKNGQLSSTYTYTNKGRLTGVKKSYFKDGHLISETNKLKNGGLITKGYYESGDLFYVYTMASSKGNTWFVNDGYYKEYYKNGVLKIESNYLKGDLNGVWNRFYENGIKEWEVEYFNNYRQGGYKKYYKNGKLKLEGTHLANLKHGEEKRYNENGVLEWKGFCLKNKFDGDWVQYDSIGKTLNVLRYKKGRLKKASHTTVLNHTKVPEGHFERVPVYPGCELLISNSAQRKCMSEKISEFIKRELNTGIASGIGLIGRQRINIVFLIDKTGKVTGVRARAPHRDLEKEAIRVIKTLPQMEPGTQRGKAVNVPYALPIIFVIQKSSKTKRKSPIDNPFLNQR